jgi:hypothetical protein
VQGGEELEAAVDNDNKLNPLLLRISRRLEAKRLHPHGKKAPPCVLTTKAAVADVLRNARKPSVIKVVTSAAAGVAQAAAPPAELLVR